MARSCTEGTFACNAPTTGGPSNRQALRELPKTNDAQLRGVLAEEVLPSAGPAWACVPDRGLVNGGRR